MWGLEKSAAGDFFPIDERIEVGKLFPEGL
jgi:hypothetical protein